MRGSRLLPPASNYERARATDQKHRQSLIDPVAPGCACPDDWRQDCHDAGDHHHAPRVVACARCRLGRRAAPATRQVASHRSRHRYRQLLPSPGDVTRTYLAVRPCRTGAALIRYRSPSSQRASLRRHSTRRSSWPRCVRVTRTQRLQPWSSSARWNTSSFRSRATLGDSRGSCKAGSLAADWPDGAELHDGPRDHLRTPTCSRRYGGDWWRCMRHASAW